MSRIVGSVSVMNFIEFGFARSSSVSFGISTKIDSCTALNRFNKFSFVGSSAGRLSNFEVGPNQTRYSFGTIETFAITFGTAASVVTMCPRIQTGGLIPGTGWAFI